MLVGLHDGNRELMIEKIIGAGLQLPYFDILLSRIGFAGTTTFILPMECHFMSYQFPYQKVGNCQLVKMMIFAASVQMGETFFFVISVPELSTKVIS